MTAPERIREMRSAARRQTTRGKLDEGLVLGGRVRRDGLGILLFAVSILGIALNGAVFPRLRRLGGVLQTVSTGILFGRALWFTIASLRRLRPVPRFLTLVELITDGAATVAGFSASTQRESSHSRPLSQWMVGASSVLSVASFALHTARLAIYLTPSRGLKDGGTPAKTGRSFLRQYMLPRLQLDLASIKARLKG